MVEVPGTRFSRVAVVLIGALAILLANLVVVDRAQADGTTPGPSGIAPTVVSAAGGETMYVWGANLASSQVQLYCPVPNPIQPQATSTASITPFYTSADGTWLAFTMPTAAALGGASSCIAGISNSSNTGVKTILIGGLPTITIASGKAPSVLAATPNLVLANFAASDQPTVSIPTDGNTDLAGASVGEMLCTSNRGGAYATTNAAIPTAGKIQIYPYALSASGAAVNSCAMVVTLGPTSKYANKTILVPGTAPQGTDARLGSTYAIGYKPPYTGPIRINVVNTTGVPDNQLYVSVAGDTSKGGTASGFPGVNTATLVTQPFTGLVNGAGGPTYNSATHSAYFEVTNGIDSGNVYLSESTTTMVKGKPVTTNISSSSSAPPSPLTSPYRYAMVEFTYDGNFYEDLTLIDQVGYSMSSALYTDAAGTKLFPNSNRSTGCLNTLVGGIERNVPAAAWSTAQPDGTGGLLRRDANGVVIGYVGAAKKPALYMTNQVTAYARYVQSLTPLTIRDKHNAANQPGEFDYTAAYGANDTWTLSGSMMSSASTPGPTLQVEGASIYGAGSNGGTGYAMYGEDGPFRVQIPQTGGGLKDYGWGNGSQVAGTGYQDLVKTIYRDFIAGFAYGYWGSKYPQPPVPGVISGSSTGPQATYFTMDPSLHAYAKAGAPSATAAWNAYDQLVRLSSTGDGGASGAYGTAYSDTFLDSALSPAIGTNAARSWQIVLGDPQYCAQLKPSPQTLRLSPGSAITVLPAGQQPPAGVNTDYVTPTPVHFTSAVTYTIKPDLPAGLHFDVHTGVISGTAQTATPRRIYTLTASDGTNAATAYVTIVVGDYSITPVQQNIAGTIGQDVTTTQGPPVAYTLGTAWATPVTFTVAPALPGTLVMNPATGLITGNLPSKASVAQAYTVTATDSKGGNATSTVWVTTMGALTPAQQTVQGVVGQAISRTKALAPSGFAGAQLTYAIVGANNLPTGLSLNPTTGIISGTPQATQKSTTVFIQGTSTAGTVGKATVSISVSNQPSSSPRATPTTAPTAAPTPSHSVTPTASPTPTRTATPTSTPTPTTKPTPARTVTPTPAASPTPTCTPPAIWIASLQQCASIA
ncbi:MAG: Ig domain-containing protein [Candidatus Nanopelagicales bacterium]